MPMETSFDMAMPGYSVRQLTQPDSGAIQDLYDKCLDYMLLVDGHPARENAGDNTFIEVPPGKSPADKFVFGVLDQRSNLVALLDVVRGYPQDVVWWIGLFLVLPELRSKGLGQKVVRGFIEYVQAEGGQAIMLGVVDENKRALDFWRRVGFELVQKTGPQQFGNKTHVVNIMLRKL